MTPQANDVEVYFHLSILLLYSQHFLCTGHATMDNFIPASCSNSNGFPKWRLWTFLMALNLRMSEWYWSYYKKARSWNVDVTDWFPHVFPRSKLINCEVGMRHDSDEVARIRLLEPKIAESKHSYKSRIFAEIFAPRPLNSFAQWFYSFKCTNICV